MTRLARTACHSLAVAVACLIGVSGCTTAPTPHPSDAAVPAAWARADIEQSNDVVSLPSGPPPVFCSPCHPSSSTALAGVATTGGTWLAVGGESVVGAAIWRTEGAAARWRRVALTTERGATLTAVAMKNGRAVAVGESGGAAAAWVSADDGATWQPSAVAAVDGAIESRILDVITTPGGFVGAGYASVGPTQRPLFWHSPDGREWTVMVGSGTGRPHGIAAGAAGGSSPWAATGSTSPLPPRGSRGRPHLAARA